MTISKIYAKLRRFNKSNYKFLFLCIMLSVVLVTSYALIYLSPTVQDILLPGGDSRKQGTMIFAAAIIGCAIFTIYASSLFYRYKSRETGIFLALGANKKWLCRAIFSDVLILAAVSCTAGLLLSVPISFGIWKLFQLVIVDTQEMAYQFGWSGMLVGIIFSGFSGLCIFMLGVRFIGRTNIIDIINEHRKSESVPKVKRGYGIAGIILIVLGFFLGLALPSLLIRVYQYSLPAVWNGVYLLAAAGVYLLMIYIVLHAKRGKHPEKYYKNIISTSMMRFMGKQTVKNMCVIILLIFGGLFAIFYTPIIWTGVSQNIKNNPHDFSYTYEMRVGQIRGAALEDKAKTYDLSLSGYTEAVSIEIISDGNQWFYPESGQAYSEYIEQYSYKRFYKAADMEKLMGVRIPLKEGEYQTVTVSDRYEMEGEGGCLLTDPSSGEIREFTHKGNIAYDGSLANGLMEEVYVLNNQDFDMWEKALPIESKYNTIVFDIPEWETCYDFAYDLKAEIIRHTPKDAAILSGYDRFMKKTAGEAGEAYYMDTMYPAGEGVLELTPDNAQLFAMWRYYPAFKPLQQQDTLKNMAVNFMLFIYIGIICYTAIGVIAYTRGITIAMNYSQVFQDLKLLGADSKYVVFCIKSQLKKIFFYPFLTGSIIVYLFMALIFMLNDDSYKITVSEQQALLINLLIVMGTGIYISAVYLITYRKFREIIKKS